MRIRSENRIGRTFDERRKRKNVPKPKRKKRNFSKVCSVDSALDPLEKEREREKVVTREGSRFECVTFEKGRRTLVTLVTWNRFRRRTGPSKTLKGKRRKIEQRI